MSAKSRPYPGSLPHRPVGEFLGRRVLAEGDIRTPGTVSSAQLARYESSSDPPTSAGNPVLDAGVTVALLCGLRQASGCRAAGSPSCSDPRCSHVEHRANILPKRCPNPSGLWAKFKVCSGAARLCSHAGPTEKTSILCEESWWARQGSNL